MKFLESTISRNSISFKLIISVLTVMIPVISLLIYNSFYAKNVVRNQVADSYKNMMTLYMMQLDNSLSDVDNYLTNLEAFNTELQIMEFTNDDQEYYFSKLSLLNKVKSDITMYKWVSSIFVYSAKQNNFLEVENEQTGKKEKRDIADYITSLCKNAGHTAPTYMVNWYAEKIGGDYYVFRILRIGETYIGACIKAENLLIPLNLMEMNEKGISLLVTEEGIPMMQETVVNDNQLDLNLNLSQYHLVGNKYKYLLVGKKSMKGNYSLIVLIPDQMIMEKLPYLQRINTLVSFGLIGLLPLYLFLLRRILLVPLKHLMRVMKRIREGHLEVRVEPYAAPNEIQMVYETFNTMMSQIQELKINVYEEKISRQKAELQHLQLQINPHFFLNSLNIIYALSITKNFEVIKEMSLCLIQYFRYIFKSNLTFVSLKDELKHVLNYIRIQELRFTKSLIWEVDAPEFLLDTHVPPLLIHTFVENSIKYAVTIDEPAKLSIRIQFECDTNTEQYIRLTMEDTGKGFKEDMLMKLREGSRIVDERGEHIGIWNLQKRLELLYKGKARIKFNNGKQGGAVVEILLPLKRKNWNVEVENGTSTDC